MGNLSVFSRWLSNNYRSNYLKHVILKINVFNDRKERKFNAGHYIVMLQSAYRILNKFLTDIHAQNTAFILFDIPKFEINGSSQSMGSFQTWLIISLLYTFLPFKQTNTQNTQFRQGPLQAPTIYQAVEKLTKCFNIYTLSILLLTCTYIICIILLYTFFRFIQF